MSFKTVVRFIQYLQIIITKCCSPYYTMRTNLLQNTAIIITKCITYYKMHNILQNVAEQPSNYRAFDG